VFEELLEKIAPELNYRVSRESQQHEVHMGKHQNNKSITLKTTVMVLAALLFSMIILGCGGNGSPVDVAKEYMNSIVNNDFSRAYELLAQSNKEAKSVEEFKPSIGEETREYIKYLEYSLIEITPTDAKVRITHPEEDDFVLLLVREDGEWKIDFDASMDYVAPVESGTRITLEILGDYSESDIEGAIATIEARLSSLEIYSRNVRRDDGNVVVEIPGDEDVSKVVEILTQSGELQFREVLEVIGEDDPKYAEMPSTTIDPDDEEAYLALREEEITLPYVTKEGDVYKVRLGPTRLTGDIIAMADAQVDASRGGYKITFRLTDEATPELAALTQELMGKQIAIVLDYKLESFPTVQEAIETGEGEITGDFTREEAGEIVTIIKAGAFPVRFGKNPVIEEF